MQTPTTFFWPSEEEGLRSLCSEGDLGGLLPGEPSDEGGLVEGFGEGSGPKQQSDTEQLVYAEAQLGRHRKGLVLRNKKASPDVLKDFSTP